MSWLSDASNSVSNAWNNIPAVGQSVVGGATLGLNGLLAGPLTNLWNGNGFNLSDNSPADATTPYTDQSTGTPPAFIQDYNPTSMSEVPAYLQEQAANSSGINALRSNASNPGSSPWATAAMNQGQTQTNNAIDKGVASAAGQTNAANSALAMQGGLSEGAREHNAEAGEKSAMSMSQGLNQSNAMNNLGIQTQDQSNKLNELGQLTNAEGQQVAGFMGAKNADTQNTINENQAQNAYNMNLYGINAQTAAANNNSAAVAQSAPKGIFGGGGCFITTAMCGHFGLADDCTELETLRKFRDSFMTENEERKEDVKEYYRLAKKYASQLAEIEDSDFWSTVRSFIDLAVAQIQADKKDEAYLTYKDLVTFVELMVIAEKEMH